MPHASRRARCDPHDEVAIDKDDSSAPDMAGVVAAVENKALCEAVLESIIGERSVSPATKQSVASRVSELLKSPAS
ncbi:hypothetical protein EJB05_33151, partial [Eragrostis curvula]